MFAPATDSARWAFHSSATRDQAHVEVHPTARLVINDFELLREAARAGLGIASLPEVLCKEDLTRGRLRAVLAPWCTEETPLHAVYPSARHLSPKVIAFVDLVRELFPSVARHAASTGARRTG
jgi:DNA-binding transcriptional LysR family regulator